MTREIIVRIASTIGIILFAWFLWGKMFPEDIDVKPVLEEDIEIKKEIQRINKKVIEDEKIDVIKPIPDIPIVPISLQSNEQSTNEVFNTEIENGSSSEQSYFKIEPSTYKDAEESRTTWQEPAEVKRFSSPAPVIPKTECTLDALQYLPMFEGMGYKPMYDDSGCYWGEVYR